MSDETKFKLLKIAGSRSVKREEIKDYLTTMEKETIPAIVDAIRRRQVAVRKSRHKIILEVIK